MPSPAVFGISVAFSFVVWGIVTYQYVWPALRSQPRANALQPILLLHSFRFVGLGFLVPGVVSPELPIEFATPAAYGDLATAILALLACATLRSPLGISLVWAFNLLGTADLLHAFYQGNRTGLVLAPGLQGAAYFIPTVLVPLLLITHGLVFRLLLQGGEHPVITPRPRSRFTLSISFAVALLIGCACEPAPLPAELHGSCDFSLGTGPE